MSNISNRKVKEESRRLARKKDAFDMVLNKDHRSKYIGSNRMKSKRYRRS